MQDHVRHLVGLLIAWAWIIVGWVPNLATIDVLARIALSVMGFISAYYATRYYKRNSAK